MAELTPQDVIRHLVTHNPNVSVDEIVAKLEQLGLNVPTRYYIATYKGYVRDVLRFLRRAGLLIDKPHELPISMRGPRKRVPRQNENDARYAGEEELLGRRSEPVLKRRRRRKRSKPTPKRFDEFYYK